MHTLYSGLISQSPRLHNSVGKSIGSGTLGIKQAASTKHGPLLPVS